MAQGRGIRRRVGRLEHFVQVSLRASSGSSFKQDTIHRRPGYICRGLGESIATVTAAVRWSEASDATRPRRRPGAIGSQEFADPIRDYSRRRGHCDDGKRSSPCSSHSNEPAAPSGPLLRNAVPPSKFLADVTPLTWQQRALIVQQAIMVLEGFYVNLSHKRSMYAVDPLRRLRLLQQRLHTHFNTDRLFHEEMTRIFSSLNDLHANYLLPAPFNDASAWLPFTVEFCSRPGQPDLSCHPGPEELVQGHLVQGGRRDRLVERRPDCARGGGGGRSEPLRRRQYRRPACVRTVQPDGAPVGGRCRRPTRNGSRSDTGRRAAARRRRSGSSGWSRRCRRPRTFRRAGYRS